MKEPVCTVSSLAAEEPLIGSAPDAIAWVCLEQNGPWGAKALTNSRLDPQLGKAIEELAAAHGVRPSLIRAAGRHPDTVDAARTVMVAHTHPENPWLLMGKVTDPGALLDLDWAAVAGGDQAAVIASLPSLALEPLEQLLVCTNGTRDTCCARFGRPIVDAVAFSHPGRTWEVTHTSGHRLAPTSVLLPSGYLHGRLAVSDGPRLLAAADQDELELTGLRGRSTWSAAGQAAEDVVRRTFEIIGLHDLTVSKDLLVSHVDGRTWQATVTTSIHGERAESCGKPLKPVMRQDATITPTGDR